MGKKKIMGRQLPFDVYVQRKLDKWNRRAATYNLDFIDAVGISPICELIYFWNGYKRMQPMELERCLEKISWSKEHGKVEWSRESVDEQGIYTMLRGTIFRHLNRIKEARIELKELAVQDRSQFKGGHKDNWTLPTAHYELAVTYWIDFKFSGLKADLVESQKWLEIVAAWESYDLDAR